MVKVTVEANLDSRVMELLRNLTALLKTSPENFLAEHLQSDFAPDNVEGNLDTWLEDIADDLIAVYGLRTPRKEANPSNTSTT